MDLHEIDTAYRASIRKNSDKEDYKLRTKLGKKGYKSFIQQAEKAKKGTPLRKGEVLRPKPGGGWVSNKDEEG